jgi:hypothetical protein
MLFLISLYLVYPWHRQWVVAQAMQLYPVEATRYLQMNEIEGRLFSPMEYSDYILFAAYPRIKVFYDVRLEIYGEQLTRDYITMNNAGGGWQELFRKHDINVVVTKASGRLFAAMSVAAAYSKVYEDGASAIFLPNAGALPASHQLRHPGILHQ